MLEKYEGKGTEVGRTGWGIGVVQLRYYAETVYGDEAVSVWRSGSHPS